MRSSIRLLAALAALILGCNEPTTPPSADPPAPPDAPAAAPAPAAAAAPEAESLPLPAAGRRERAGIDLADGNTGIRARDDKARVPAAEFIVTTPAATVPKLDMGARANAAQGALRWLRDTWSAAAQADDEDAYAALLHSSFKGRKPDQSDPIGPGDWTEARTPAVGAPVSWAPEEITATPGATGSVTIAVREARKGTDGCVVGTRTLTLLPAKPDGDSGWTLTTEELAQVSPCPAATIRDVRGVSERLRIAWGARDLSAVRAAVHGGFALLDGGIESARYNMTELTTGPGRWVLDQLAQVKASTANTKLIGDRAVVTDGRGSHFVFGHVAGTWRLTSLWRQGAATR